MVSLMNRHNGVNLKSRTVKLRYDGLPGSQGAKKDSFQRLNAGYKGLWPPALAVALATGINLIFPPFSPNFRLSYLLPCQIWLLPRAERNFFGIDTDIFSWKLWSQALRAKRGDHHIETRSTYISDQLHRHQNTDLCAGAGHGSLMAAWLHGNSKPHMKHVPMTRYGTYGAYIRDLLAELDARLFLARRTSN